MLISLTVEKLASKDVIDEKITMIIHMVNAASSMFVPCVVVLLRPPSPFSGIILLMASMITCLKLTSYVMANRQFRSDRKEMLKKGMNDTMEAFVEKGKLLHLIICIFYLNNF